MTSSISRRKFLVGSGAAVSAVALPASQVFAADKQSTKPKFQLGTVTYNIAKDWDIPTIIRILSKVGFTAVELRTTHRHGVEPSLSKGERAEVRKRFADSPVNLWGLGTTCEFHSRSKRVVERNIETSKRFSELAADVGAAGIKVRPNGLPRGVPVEKTLEQIGQSLIPCGKAAADMGVEIWVEVHGRGSGHPPHMKAMMEHCGHPGVGITWNSNRTDLKEGQIKPYFDLLRPWIKSCHITELWSSYPWRELFTLLRETGYDRYTLAEIPGMPDPESGERLLHYYGSLWRELAGAAPA